MPSTMVAEMGPLGIAGRTVGFVAVVVGTCAWLSASATQKQSSRAREESYSAPAPPTAPAPRNMAEAAPMPGSAVGLILYGVTGGGSAGLAAIIGPESGGQRLVELGNDYRPGMKLTEVGADYAVLLAGDRPARLELRRFGEAAPAGTPSRSEPETEQRIETAALRHILKPVRATGRIGGYAVQGGESLPQLRKAGLQAGDVIVSVNGSQFDEERMAELAWEMRNADKTEFVFVRKGKRMRTSI